MKFIADVMLGKLARLLRMAGFDTLYFGGITDRDLVEKARSEERILLTRDHQLLKNYKIERGLFIISDVPDEQLREVILALDLSFQENKFLSICLICNQPVKAARREEIKANVPVRIYEAHENFFKCLKCGRVYWHGSHYNNMKKRLKNIFH